jgi:hypothetical protein
MGSDASLIDDRPVADLDTHQIRIRTLIVMILQMRFNLIKNLFTLKTKLKEYLNFPYKNGEA